MRNNFKEEGSKLFVLQKMIPTYELSIGLALRLQEQTGEKHYIEEAFQLVEILPWRSTMAWEQCPWTFLDMVENYEQIIQNIDF